MPNSTTKDTKDTQRFTKGFAAIPEESERVGRAVLNAAFAVHTALGPGLLESVYKKCLAYELKKRGIRVETEVATSLEYDGHTFDNCLFIDMLVEQAVIVELKSVEQMNPVYEAQLLTYLKLSGKRLGYLINFNVEHLKEGIKRRVI